MLEPETIEEWRSSLSEDYIEQEHTFESYEAADKFITEWCANINWSLGGNDREGYRVAIVFNRATEKYWAH